MLMQSNVKTDLEAQEAMIEGWKKENKWQEGEVINTNKTQWNTAIASPYLKRPTTVSKPNPKPKTKPMHQLRPKKNETDWEKQAEYAKKLKAQQSGNPDPDWYYSEWRGKVKRSKRKISSPSPSKYPKFTGNYTAQKGDNPARLIMGLLEKHEYIDVDILVSQLNFNRQAFLAHAKKLEKLGLLVMVKTGVKVDYLERVK